jgi:type III restriction enzyme
MKIKFDSELIYQQDAIKSIFGIFKGQEVCQSNFSVPKWDFKSFSQAEQLQIPLFGKDHAPSVQASLLDDDLKDIGVGNKLSLLPEEILENLREIQLKNGLPQSEDLTTMNFTVEMETGTGKTYVYLRSIFELNKLYGFTKFIIVVPSIAIKEGVYKSLQITKDHFKSIYDNINYDYFIYDSQQLGQVRNFATNDCIQIMVINIDAFRKSFSDPSKESKANIIHRPIDRMNDIKPIDFIRSTNPIVIVDEPQSVDSTPKSKDALASLNPMCCFRYSATHKDFYNLLYKLDSIDAYEQKLVKQIEVASIEVKDGHNKAYIKLLSVSNSSNKIRAKIELDVISSGRVQRKTKTVKQNDDLFDLSGGRDAYSGYIINDIDCSEGEEYIDFTSQADIIVLGKAIGETNVDEYKKLQIRKTIEEHFEKELRLRPKNIKVLSLFFLDKVSNYRTYGDNGETGLGKYAKMFEEEARKILKKPKYKKLLPSEDVDSFISSIHEGYFSADKKSGKIKDTTGKSADDESAFNLIMKEKERLLSFSTDLRFIFSHSALREGWDNPNVFQICTLNETNTVMKKRQEIGRGLRICVNQDGERIHGFDVNTLTVMANESYEEFVEKLQKEIEEDNNIKFGVIEKHIFASIVFKNSEGEENYLGADSSEELWNSFKDKGYINDKGKIQDSLKQAIKDDSVEMPEEFVKHSSNIQRILRKVAGNLNIKDANKKKNVRLNKEVYLGEEFKELWERIKHKTVYRVSFDIDELVENCVSDIQKKLSVGKTRFIYKKAETKVDRSGVTSKEVSQSTHIYDVKDYVLPDIISYLQNETNLTRKTLVDILVKSKKLKDFTNNPQKFIDEVRAIMQSNMRQFVVNGIKYQKIGDEHYYTQELFETEELSGYLERNMIPSDKSVYDHVIYDSEVEKKFAEQFEISNDVKVFAKLPSWFKIDTPLGSYNPDWAVLVERDGESKLYFVVETKGSILSDSLRPAESAKITCGREHFKALGTDVTFTEADNFDTFQNKL